MEPITGSLLKSGKIPAQGQQMGPDERLGKGVAASPNTQSAQEGATQVELNSPNAASASKRSTPLRALDILSTLNRAFNFENTSVAKFLDRAPVLPGIETYGGSELEAPPRGQLVERSTYAAASLNRSLSFSLTTQEGDEVTVFIESSQSGERSTLSTPNEFYASERFESRQLFSFSVSGDLSETELGELDQFVQSLSTSVEAFFDLGIDEAVSSLQKLSFDPNVIAGFELNLQSTAIATYEQVQTYVVDPAADFSILNRSPLGQAYGATQSFFDQVMQEAQALPERMLEQYLGLLLPAIEHEDAQKRAREDEQPKELLLGQS